MQAADGYYRILGRIDNVIHVAGHRLGTKEIESASLLIEEVAEAAMIPARDEIKDKVPDLYVSLKPGRQPSEEVRKRVENSVIREIGPIARPRRVVIVPDMPKTRSGKIMRRVLAAISVRSTARSSSSSMLSRRRLSGSRLSRRRSSGSGSLGLGWKKNC